MPADKFDDGFSDALMPPPSIGHNKGPIMLPIGPELEDRLLKTYAEILARAKELGDKRGFFVKIKDNKDLARFTEYVAQLQEVMTGLKGAIDIEGSPYRTGEGQVRGVLGDPRDTAEKIKRDVEAEMTAYNRKILADARAKAQAEAAAKLKAEQDARQKADKALAEERRLRLEAQRKLDEATAKAAAAQKPKLPPAPVFKAIAKADEAGRKAAALRDVADDASAEATIAQRAAGRSASDITRKRSPNAVSSSQEFIDVRGVDRKTVDLEALRPFLKLEDIEEALRAYGRLHGNDLKRVVRAGGKQPIAGAEFWINLRTRTAR